MLIPLVDKNCTPLIKQYFTIKEEYPDSLLLFQVGDFYELFFGDAQKASSFLGIALTSRGKYNEQPIPLCGVPVHTLDFYLAKLIKGGFNVAICDQLELAVPGKVVERGVTQLLTPGTLTNPALLNEKTSSYLLCFIPHEKKWALLFGELMTAQLSATYLDPEQKKQLETELARFIPDEIVIPQEFQKALKGFFNGLGYYVTPLSCNDTQKEQAILWINKQFAPNMDDDESQAIKIALQYFYTYLSKTHHNGLDQFKTIEWYKPEDFLIMDASTQRNLEIVRPLHDGGAANTLFEHMDVATTPMGSRLIKKWLQKPLVDKKAIEQRLDAVSFILENVVLVQETKSLLAEIGDIERIIGRIALSRAPVTDYVKLVQSLPKIFLLKQRLMRTSSPTINSLGVGIDSAELLLNFLESTLEMDSVTDSIIKMGFDEQLDYLRMLKTNSTELLLQLERTEQQKTGINALKIGYNSVQGYYFEVSRSNAELLPAYFIRHQTLVGKERFTTAELKNLEYDLNQAKVRFEQRQKELFELVKVKVHTYISSLRKSAQVIATFDALSAFAHLAYNFSYTRPLLNEQQIIEINEGKHPIIQKKLAHHCIANHTLLNQQQTLWIITGPNMGGKSTYLRQVALISLMAHCGSFVPARSANITILDRIFTRIGSGDNVAQGKSTFLIEMEETALICSQATYKSLVILDEVGRGTSTFDGMAIAQAVIEYLYTFIKARCLFATHYHELTALKELYSGIVCYYAASKKINDKMILLYSIVPGIADGSFGIEVAKLAELPSSVIERAKELIEQLSENKQPWLDSNPSQDESYILKKQLAVYKEFHEKFKNLDLNELTPRQAMDFLWLNKSFTTFDR